MLKWEKGELFEHSILILGKQEKINIRDRFIKGKCKQLHWNNYDLR